MVSKNLLIIAPSFPIKEDNSYDCIYIKEQLKFLKEYFENVYVIIPTPFVPTFIKKLHFISKKTWLDLCRREDYVYDNVHVIFPKFTVFPFFPKKKSVRKMFFAANKTIEKDKIKFDIIHAHFTYPSGYIAAMIKNIHKKPLVITVHEDANWFKSETEDDNCVFVWRNADSIIRVNEKDTYLFYDKGIQKDRVNYIPNGYDHTLFKGIKKSDARKSLNLPQDKKIILNIGTLEKRKGQKLLVKVVKSLREKYRDLQLMIIGKGPLRSELENIIISENLEDVVFLLGADKKREEIPLWMNACNIFALSSYSEGNPTVMFEALGCGTPYVGSDVGGSSSVIKSNDVGILFKPGDIKDMTIKIEEAITKKWDKKKIRKYSRRYSWKSISLQIKKVYDKVML